MVDYKNTQEIIDALGKASPRDQPDIIIAAERYLFLKTREVEECAAQKDLSGMLHAMKGMGLLSKELCSMVYVDAWRVVFEQRQP